MTATYTIPERLALSVAAFLVAAVAVFGIVHVAPNRHLFPQNETVGTLGLYWSAIMLLAGVWLIARWRRKRRPRINGLPPGWTVEMISAEEAWKCEPVPMPYSTCQTPDDLRNRTRMMVESIHGALDPTTELRRHLTDALSVMLRNPELVVDAGALRLLSRKPKPIRDAKGRWRKA